MQVQRQEEQVVGTRSVTIDGSHVIKVTTSWTETIAQKLKPFLFTDEKTFFFSFAVFFAQTLISLAVLRPEVYLTLTSPEVAAVAILFVFCTSVYFYCLYF